jgi:glycosyltransferase involved in cell wall biosynthesis
MDLIHNHGLWMFPNLYARQAAKRCSIPLVISPRGMLEAWALRRSRWRKRAVWHTFERSNLQEAALFHATSRSEADAIRRLGFKQPIATIGNGVSMPDLENAPAAERLINRFPELGGKRWLLFLARLHPVKGIDSLLRSWGEIHERFADWHLVVAGPAFGNYDAELKDIANMSGSKHRVTFTGMLEGNDKSAAMANAELFVMPSHSESFGLVIAEALAHGVPVITTRQTPWAELETRRSGWWIEDNRDKLGEGLIEAMSREPAELRRMGERGRQWMARDYSWDTVADKMLQAYRWILDGGEKPDFIAS